MDRRLPGTLASLYSPHLTCRLSLAQAHLLVNIADTILLLPNYNNLPTSVASLHYNCFHLFRVFLKYYSQRTQKHSSLI